MNERFERPGPPPEADTTTAAGAVLLITAVVVGVAGIILVTLGQFLAAPLLPIAVAIWAAGKWKMKHHAGPPPSPPAAEP